MKFVAFILALVLGLIIWFFTFGFVYGLLIVFVFGQGSSGGMIPMLLLVMLPIYWIVKKLYLFFLKKFGYEQFDYKDE